MISERFTNRQGKTLGQGTYSVVKEAIHIDSGRYYAAKVINKRLMSGREHLVRNEIVVLKRLSQGHKNVLTLIDYFETANNLYLVTDYARGGELFDRIYNKGSFYESNAAAMIRQITAGVAYLHSHGIVHRDLKPENLLFLTPDEDSELMIADFGLSRIIDEEKFRMLTTTCGTPAYMAPEIFQKTGHHKPVDVWAIGVITYFLLCGYTPFDRDTSAEEMSAIMAADYAFEPEEYWQDVSDTARDFITKCLKVDPSERMTAQQCLEHPFLAHPQANGTKNDASVSSETDLLPHVMSNMRRRASSMADNSRQSQMADQFKTLTTMDGALSLSPEASRPSQRPSQRSSRQGTLETSGAAASTLTETPTATMTSTGTTTTLTSSGEGTAEEKSDNGAQMERHRIPTGQAGF